MTVYVSCLPYATTNDDLMQVFASYGPVAARIVFRDGQPTGFGFVDFSHDKDAVAAIERLNGTVLGGRSIKVASARPRR